MSSPVFISYRRSDSQHATGRLFARLAPRFLAEAEIFMDVEAIAAGADFATALRNQLRDCKVCLVMIGPDWLNQKDAQGNRRLDNPADFVRLEVAEVLNRNITVIPVLVDNARMPSAAELPDPLKPLATRNAMHIVHERFDEDADAVAAKVLKALGRSPDAEMDLLKLLFSFKGMISRAQYWIGLGAILVAQLAVLAGLLWSLGVPVLDAMRNVLDLPADKKTLVQFAMLWVWWPVMALVWKRIKDLGHGWDFFVPFLGTMAAEIAFDFAGMKAEAGVASLVFLLLVVILGMMKGTRFVAHEA